MRISGPFMLETAGNADFPSLEILDHSLCSTRRLSVHYRRAVLGPTRNKRLSLEQRKFLTIGRSWQKPGACFSKVAKLSGDIILFVSSKRRWSVSQNFAVILIFIPKQHMKRSALQNKRVGVLGVAFRARKVFGSFEKRTLVRVARSTVSANQR